MGKSTADNSGNNKILGIILIVLQLAGLIIGFRFHTMPATWLWITLFVLAVILAAFNLTATERVDNWVGISGWVLCVLIVGAYALSYSSAQMAIK